MTAPRRFPSPVKLIVAILLRDEPALADTGTEDDPIFHVGDAPEYPTALRGGQLPYVHVGSLRGARDDITDLSFVDVNIWAADADEADALAEEIADKHIQRRKSAVGYGVLDRVRVSIRPQPVPWGDTNVSRRLVQFQVSARRTGG